MIAKEVSKAENETKDSPAEKTEKVEPKPDEKDGKPISEKRRKKRRDKDVPKKSTVEAAPQLVAEPEPVTAPAIDNNFTVDAGIDTQVVGVPRDPKAPEAPEQERLMSPEGIQRRRRESAEHYVVSTFIFLCRN